MMSKRERYLSLAVLVIVGSYGVFLLVQRAFLAPLDAQTAQIRNLNNAIDTHRKEIDRAIKATGQIAEWEERSLPADEQRAQAMYQGFLFKLMSDCKIDERDVALSVEKPQKGKFYTAYPFNIRGKMSLETLTEFLYRFNAHQKNILHQVHRCTISRAADASGKNLQVALSVAALALNSAPARTQLVPDDAPKPEIDDRPLDTFKLIAQKNIFEPYREPRVEPVAPAEPQIDTAEHVVLSGFTRSDGAPTAWLYNRLTKESKTLQVGDEIDIGGIKGRLASVSASGIVVRRDNDKEWTLKLGKKLREMKETATAATASSSPDSSDSGETNGTAEPDGDKTEKLEEKSASPKGKLESVAAADKLESED